MRFAMYKSTSITGLGSQVLRIVDTSTGEELGYLGSIGGKDVLHFVRPVPVRRLTLLLQQIAEQQDLSPAQTGAPLSTKAQDYRR